MGDGWIKDGDYNSTFSKTVLPLPYHAKQEYITPPGRLEDEWVYKQFPERLAELSHALRHARMFSKRIEVRKQMNDAGRS